MRRGIGCSGLCEPRLRCDSSAEYRLMVATRAGPTSSMCRGSAPAREQVPDTPTETLSHFLNAVLIVTRRKYYHRTQRIALTLLHCAECGDVVRPAWLWPRRPGSVTQSGRSVQGKLTHFTLWNTHLEIASPRAYASLDIGSRHVTQFCKRSIVFMSTT